MSHRTMQSSCDVLRQITRFLYLAKKLRSHLDTQRLPEAAECLYELGTAALHSFFLIHTHLLPHASLWSVPLHVQSKFARRPTSPAFTWWTRRRSGS